MSFSPYSSHSKYSFPSPNTTNTSYERPFFYIDFSTSLAVVLDFPHNTKSPAFLVSCKSKDMSDDGSYYSSEGDPFGHLAYGATVVSDGVGMDLLSSGIPAGNEPIPRVPRSLYDPIHCGACNSSTDRSGRYWKEDHINDNIECRRAYFNGTCEYEREAYATRPDPICRPGVYVPPTQHPNPQLQIREIRAYSSNPPVTQSETQSTQAFLIRQSPQYAQEHEHSDRRLSPNAYQNMYPSTWLHSQTHHSQPDQGYAQHPTEMHDESYTGDASHNSSPAYDSEAQRAPAATVGASQGREYTSTTRNSGSGHRHRRGGGSSRRG
ncbi:hypothetical protein BHYA_0110g00140 [Botrytis hyacinthi]|uniref:Uncharacterized protein n=1 Tax=Botrytis hyacinthi TaxID=278943 RepID=A0A4Z1GNI3_9HELO|nr:hypothetical protein BHYA_0110g00140 [Botrytis hyacinthi]